MNLLQWSPPPVKKALPSIVIADDDDEIRNYLYENLSSDYNIIACSDGKAALLAIQKHQPQLVITDVMMPEMDGNELCIRLKGDAMTSHIPIIMLTAKDRDEDMMAGLTAGADAYLSKPFNLDILCVKISNFINVNKIILTKYRNDKNEEKVEDIQMESPDEQLMSRVMKVINDNISDEDFSVEFLASEVGLSRVHFYRKLKELTNQTPCDFIRNIRLKKAAQILATTNCNVTTVMYSCGFANASSFSTMFKRMYGVSPRQYMQEHKSEENKTEDEH